MASTMSSTAVHSRRPPAQWRTSHCTGARSRRMMTCCFWWMRCPPWAESRSRWMPRAWTSCSRPRRRRSRCRPACRSSRAATSYGAGARAADRGMYLDVVRFDDVVAPGRDRGHAGDPAALRAGCAGGRDRAEGCGHGRAAQGNGGGGARVDGLARRLASEELGCSHERGCARRPCRASRTG